jgi:spermidine synthase
VTTHQRWLFPAVFLVSAAALAYELLLMRLLSIVQWHHFAYMIISLALLGYGASGTFIALFRRFLERHFLRVWSLVAALFAAAMVACFALGQRVPFNALAIVWEPRQFLYLTTLYLVFFVPFFFAALCIGLAFTCSRAQIGRIYFFDLFGAGIGALGVVGALFVLTPQEAVRVFSGIALVASALAAFAARSRYLFGTPLAGAVLLLALPASLLELRMSPYKGLSEALQTVGTRVLGGYSSPLGLLTVVESPRVPFRHAPGLSFATRFEPPEQLALFTDGESFSTITRFDGDFGELGYMQDMTSALPYRLLERPRVLVLGAGGGSDVLMALYHGASRVDAVELNPQTVRLVAETFAGFTGALYDRPRVAVHVAEARGFVARSEDEYDLIQISLLDSFAASGSGVQSLSESYLYTVEALQEYLAHLAPGGVLSITRWLNLPPRDSLKLIAAAAEALRRSGAPDPDKRVAMIRSWNTATILVRNGAFTPEAIRIIRSFASSHSFDMAWYPSMPASEANRFNLLPEPWLYRGAAALLGREPQRFIDRYKFYIAPATDDRPYFFRFYKWSAFEEVMGLRAHGGAGLIEWGYLILLATVVQAAIAGAVLILLPLILIRPEWPQRFGRRMGVYFFLLGLAFMFVEIAFIQKFILFLSHPLYAVAVVLAGFLLFAGLGSAWTAHRLRSGSHRISVGATVAVIGAVAAIYLAALPSLFDRFLGLADGVRIAISLLLIAPLAFAMGMPFPVGLAKVAREAAAFIPWAWGLNGFASVLSASLATLLAIEFGFTAVIVAALALYAGAALVIPRSP